MAFSALIYTKFVKNDSLDRIQLTGFGARIGATLVQAQASADDMTVLSEEQMNYRFWSTSVKSLATWKALHFMIKKSVLLKKNTIKKVS